MLINLEGVTKVFYTDEVETHALAGIHLEIRNGEYLAIAGPSGCGKSTLLSILGLLDTPTGGTYMLNSRPVANLTAAERARTRNREIGFIFQSFNLIGDLTVYENVELPLTYRGMKPAERRKRVEEALERVGMAHRARHLPSQLSGGQQQRVAVARAVAGNPPSCWRTSRRATWTRRTARRSWTLLQELHRAGATIAMVTHDPRVRAARRSLHSPVRRPHRRGERRRDGVAAFTVSDAVQEPWWLHSVWLRVRSSRSTAMTSTSPAPAGYSILERMPQTPVISLKNIEKFYQHGLQRTLRAAPRVARHQARRVRLDHGPVGRRQVHAAAHPRHARQRVDAASTSSTASRCTRSAKRARASCRRSTSASCSRAITCSTT